MSSIPMLLVSLWGLFLCFKYQLEARFYLCWLGIGVVGVGSVSFHGTLHPTGRLPETSGRRTLGRYTRLGDGVHLRGWHELHRESPMAPVAGHHHLTPDFHSSTKMVSKSSPTEKIVCELAITPGRPPESKETSDIL